MQKYAYVDLEKRQTEEYSNNSYTQKYVIEAEVDIEIPEVLSRLLHC